jgi:hypothetical protein
MSIDWCRARQPAHDSRLEGDPLLYLLDANVLITANRLYYALERVPEYWDWLLYHGKNGHIKLPIEMIEEVREGTDDLAYWLSKRDHLEALVLGEDADITFVQAVTKAYGDDLTDEEIEIIGRDPFLISYAMNDRAGRCIVTTEVSKPKKVRANRQIPDVCDDLGVLRTDSFRLNKELNFSTSWRACIGG